MATEIRTGKDIEYRIIADKGVVVCKLYNCSDIAVIRIEKYTKTSVSVLTNRYDINDVYTGVAKCAAEDTFDVSIGMEIALAKAKRKRAIAVNKMIAKYNQDRLKDLSRLTEYGIRELPQIKEH